VAHETARAEIVEEITQIEERQEHKRRDRI
jgi:hypothetical protein